MIWSDSARDLRIENMMSCLRKDDTFSICKDSAKFNNSAGVLVFSSARCIVVSRSLSWLFSHGSLVSRNNSTAGGNFVAGTEDPYHYRTAFRLDIAADKFTSGNVTSPVQ